MAEAHARTNRLAGSTSPYLLQHQHNPVDWHSWGDEAIGRAREEEKPIFLSIGYSACHWCHVMERESFENEAIAARLNRDFVSIKVDREERPDLDEIYMTATQLMTGSGGWPMSVFLTPDLKPFFAGTYYPPEDRWGRPGFPALLEALAQAWNERRPEVLEQADHLCHEIERVTGSAFTQAPVQPSLVEDALRRIVSQFDEEYGGFGGAPKFPPSLRLELMFRKLDQRPDLGPMIVRTLDGMARGGMYDQIGGGFHRYSVDEAWLVPHFEKMLYDNALLARLYALAYDRLRDVPELAPDAWHYGRVARETLDYVLREMTHREGGIYSATDADSEGEEGRFFVWDPEEVKSVLGDADGGLFCRVYDITPRGNFEGRSIPNLIQGGLWTCVEEQGLSPEAMDEGLQPLRVSLRHQRGLRVPPLLDDKILTGWNGLMIRAFAEGYRVFGEERYQQAAERAAGFCLTQLSSDGRLLRSFRNGKAHLNAYLEDYSYLALGLLDLHAVTGEDRWRSEGLRLVDLMDELFFDEVSGSYFFTSHDHESLITRVRALQDGATPSPNSAAALALIRAASLTGADRYRLRAARLLSVAAPQMAQHPAAFANMLIAADEFLEAHPNGIAVPGADAVEVEPFISRTAVTPGESFWIGLRVNIRKGYHLNSNEPAHDDMIPTRLVVDSPDGFELITGSYPVGEAYAGPNEEPGATAISVYRGTVLIGVEAQVEADLSSGTYPFTLTLNVQLCDDQQCYAPLEARATVQVTIAAGGREQHRSEVAQLVRQAGSESDG